MQSETLSKFYYAKNLIFITNYLQLINALELYYKKKINQNILVVTNNLSIFKNRKIIGVIEDTYNIKKLETCYIDHTISIRLLLNITIFFLLKKYNSIINGNYSVNIFNIFIFLRSKKKYFVDDGTSTLLFNKNLNRGKLINVIKLFYNSSYLKLILFSSYNLKNKIFNHKIKNSYNFLKKKFLLKKIDKEQIFILGTNLINDKKYLLEKDYLNRINNIKIKFYKKNLIYFPHPREKISKNFRNFLLKKKIKLVSTNLPIEIYLLNCSSLPKGLISFYSSAFIVFKIIFKNKLNLFYYDDKIILNKFQKYVFFSDYFSKNFKKLKI